MKLKQKKHFAKSSIVKKDGKKWELFICLNSILVLKNKEKEMHLKMFG